jgi:hypothetical protein
VNVVLTPFKQIRWNSAAVKDEALATAGVALVAPTPGRRPRDCWLLVSVEFCGTLGLVGLDLLRSEKSDPLFSKREVVST